MALGIALVGGCADSGSDGNASATKNGVPSASAAAGASGGTAGGSAAPGGSGGSSPDVAGAPTAKASGTLKSGGAAGGSSAFCKDVMPPLADDQTKSGPPTAKDVEIWDHLDGEAPAGVKPDVDKVDQGLHEIQAGAAMSDITGFGIAMQDILQWVGANCGLSPQ